MIAIVNLQDELVSNTREKPKLIKGGVEYVTVFCVAPLPT